ncbi:tetratricopeptide repeat protein [Vibrio penaeicida]|uniref:tetratricopeptide repeat protein n=1 Tax=Vibrio penaeicida TaxID=104609 RepID=UPI000CE9B76E|nr:DUF4062 domain-containing protein [Vibrio penaeicida]
MDNIFFSFSFSEFKPLVEHVTKRVGESVTLQRCGLRPHHLARLEAYKSAPLENSLQHVSNSRYLVCILGQDVGSKVEEKTYIELEIEQAIEDDVDIFAFMIGDEYQHSNRMRPDISRIYHLLSSHVTVGTIASEDPEVIARKITQALEGDIWKTLGENDKFSLSHGVLNVSGFPLEHLDKLPEQISTQLRKVYRREQLKHQVSPLSADIAQRKNWAYESLNFGHVEEAIKNLQRVIDEFGSDFFSCFWLGRLYAIYGNRDEQLKKCFAINERALSMLDSDETLLHSLCFTHMAIAANKSGNIDKAKQYFEESTTTFKTYDSYEYRAELCLQQLEKSPSSFWVEGATNDLGAIQKAKLSHFLIVCKKFEEQYPTSFAQVNHCLLKKWKAFLTKTYNSTNETQEWVSTQFTYTPRMLHPLNLNDNSFEGALFASQLIWYKYKALHYASLHMLNEYSKLKAERNSYQSIAEHFQNEQADAKNIIAQSRQIIKSREEAEREKSILQTNLKKSKKIQNLVKGGVTLSVATSLAIVVDIISPPHAINLLVLGTLAVSFFLLHKQSKKVHSTDNLTHEIIALEQSLDDSLSEFWIESKSSFRDENLRDIFQYDVELSGLIQNEYLNSVESELFKYSTVLNHKLSSHLERTQKELYQLKETLFQWYDKVDQFEQYSVSAHNGQYNHMLCRKAGVMVAKKAELGSDSLRAVIYPKEDLKQSIRGRALHIDGSRLDAWFNDIEEAERMLIELNE